jgi:hypothetical protein
MTKHADSFGKMCFAGAFAALLFVACLFGGLLATVYAVDLQKYPTVTPLPKINSQITTMKQIPLPDLAVTSVSCAQASVGQGSSLTIKTTKRNIGTSPVSVASDTKYYLSTDTVVGNDLEIARIYAPAGQPAGVETTDSITVGVTASMLCGSYYILVCADANNMQPEMNEQNNCAFSPVQVRVEKPDLAITSLSCNVARISPGGEIVVTDTTSNVGSAPLHIDFDMINQRDLDEKPNLKDPAITMYTAYYLSSDGMFSSNDLYIGRRGLLALLDAGAASEGGMSMRIPTSLPRGSYYLIGYADQRGYAQECNKGNNWKVASQPLVVE